MAADRAVRHVTYLSAHGIGSGPPEIPYRAAELDLMGREAFTHSILRPAWFNRNFSEGFLARSTTSSPCRPVTGSRPLSMSKTVASVAAATLADPDAHAAARHPTGPEAMTSAIARGHHGRRSQPARSHTTTSTVKLWLGRASPAGSRRLRLHSCG